MALERRVAVVIGGAQGIGQAYCEALLQKNLKVVCGDILEEIGKETVQNLENKYGKDKIVFRKCDVTSEEDIEGLLNLAKQNFGEFDIVVNNAGIVREFDWKKCFDVNVGGVIRTTEAAFKHLAKNQGGKGGDIVITSSKSGLRPEFWGPVYAATKHAVIGYVRSWAAPENFVLTGVRLNTICPTTVDSPFLKHVSPEYMLHAESNQQHVKTIEKLPTSKCREALIQILEDPEANGKALFVAQECGLKYAEYTKDVPSQ